MVMEALKIVAIATGIESATSSQPTTNQGRNIMSYKKDQPVKVCGRAYDIDNLLGNDADKLRYFARHGLNNSVIMDAGGVCLCRDCVVKNYRDEYARTQQGYRLTPEYSIYEADEPDFYICEACGNDPFARKAD